MALLPQANTDSEVQTSLLQEPARESGATVKPGGLALTTAAAWLSQESADEGFAAAEPGGLYLPDPLQLGCRSPSKSGPDALLTALEQWLMTPMGAAACDLSTGFVAICDAVSMCAELREITGGKMAPVAEAVRTSHPNGPLTCDAEGRSVRLRGLRERVKMAAEAHFAAMKADAAGLLDLLCAPAVDELLGGLPETSEQVQTLRDALADSELVEVNGSRVFRRETWPQQAQLEAWWPMAEAGAWTESWMDQAVQAPMAPWPAGDVAWEGAAAAWWGSPAPAPQWPEGISKKRSHFKDRKEWFSAWLTELLEDPSPEVLKIMDGDGSVPVGQLLSACPDLAARSFRKQSALLRAIGAGAASSCRVVADLARQTVRLKTTAEQLCDVCEARLAEKASSEMTPLGELLLSAPVQATFARAPASSTEGEATQAAVLRQSLEASELIQVSEEAPGLHMVSLRSREERLKIAVEEVLASDAKAKSTLAREGEVSLAMLGQFPRVARCLEQAQLQGQASLEALRSAVESSASYRLDAPRMSLRPKEEEERKGSSGAAPKRTLATVAEEARRPASEASKRKQRLPAKRHVDKVRKLLGFYFDSFNLQHNQLLMSVIEAQRGQSKGASGGRAGYLRSQGQRPVFKLQDLLILPRIGKLFETYDSEFGALLLALAVASPSAGLPVKVSPRRPPGTPRGAWAAADPRLELTYMPDLRFLECTCLCPEVQPLLRPAATAGDPVRVLPAHALCVVSYSVSSELSNAQSPKGLEMQDYVVSGTVDPALLMWDCRVAKIRRQILMYDPDIICVQGLQSIGYAERCSEWDQTNWFSYEDEPTSNHLVHLYREVSQANYGVVFAPTMAQPGSSVVCLGNAIFWKRSRWQVERQWSVQNVAVCAELLSRKGGWRLAVCSAKAPAVLAREWGDEKVSDKDMATSMLEVQASLMEAASNGFKPLWCGDFGLEAQAFMPLLRAEAGAGEAELPTWRSVCSEVLGEEPWTSISKYTAHRAVDLILHNGGFRTLGTLSGLTNKVSLASFLTAGYPSDHLMQLAVFVDAERQVEVVDERAFPALGEGEKKEKRAWPRAERSRSHENAIQ